MEALERGVRCLLSKQLPNGDWPQVRCGPSTGPTSHVPMGCSWAGPGYGDWRFRNPPVSGLLRADLQWEAEDLLELRQRVGSGLVLGGLRPLCLSLGHGVARSREANPPLCMSGADTAVQGW